MPEIILVTRGQLGSGVKFSKFFFEIFTNYPRLTNTVKGCKKVISFLFYELKIIILWA
jgi:hypothetical protein